MLIERRRGDVAAVYASDLDDLRAAEAAVVHEVGRGRRCNLFAGQPRSAHIAAALRPETSRTVLLLPEKPKSAYRRPTDAIGAALLALHTDLSRLER